MNQLQLSAKLIRTAMPALRVTVGLLPQPCAKGMRGQAPAGCGPAPDKAVERLMC